MNTLLAILKVTDARRDVILAGGLYHRFRWRHLPPWVLRYSNFYKNLAYNNQQKVFVDSIMKALIETEEKYTAIAV